MKKIRIVMECKDCIYGKKLSFDPKIICKRLNIAVERDFYCKFYKSELMKKIEDSTNQNVQCTDAIQSENNVNVHTIDDYSNPESSTVIIDALIVKKGHANDIGELKVMFTTSKSSVANTSDSTVAIDPLSKSNLSKIF
jgi:hypothetical protein